MSRLTTTRPRNRLAYCDAVVCRRVAESDLADLLPLVRAYCEFNGVEWKPGLGNAPILAGSVASFQCRAANRYYGGDHVIFLGAVESYTYNKQEPLLFARGGFGRFTADDAK